jgi:hypothetical protein
MFLARRVEIQKNIFTKKSILMLGSPALWSLQDRIDVNQDLNNGSSAYSP